MENVKFFKFLGIMFDEHLTWKNHITMITNKLFKVIGILNRLKNIYPQQALLSIYNAFFLSHMTYGLLLWGNQVEQVSKLQKKSIRLITGSEYLAHSEPLFKELELLKRNNSENIRKKFMKRHTLILDSTSMSLGYTYLHIPMNALYPIALNVDILGTLL